jgi:hypothetical protein
VLDVERAILKAVLVLCFFVSVMLVACSENPDRREVVETYDVGPANMHTEGDVDYAQSPPVGGEHNPIWQNCGFCEEPVRSETAVHSLEHGAVWITYSPDLPQDEIDRLRDLVGTVAQSEDHVLVSPYPGLDSPLVASAWGKQLRLQSASAYDLERFIRTYSESAPAPDPGVPCTGGVGRPE